MNSVVIIFQILRILNNCFVCYWPILIYPDTPGAHFLLVVIYPTKRKLVFVNSLDYPRQCDDVAKVCPDINIFIKKNCGYKAQIPVSCRYCSRWWKQYSLIDSTSKQGTQNGLNSIKKIQNRKEVRDFDNAPPQKKIIINVCYFIYILSKYSSNIPFQFPSTSLLDGYHCRHWVWCARFHGSLLFIKRFRVELQHELDWLLPHSHGNDDY